MSHTIKDPLNPIKTQKHLQELRNTILNEFTSLYKIEIVDPSHAQKSGQQEQKQQQLEEKYEKETPKKGQMHEDVSKMQESMVIPDALESRLMELEETLVSEGAKKHITRKCSHRDCERIAPSSYPKNIYLCDEHREPLYRQFASYNIPINKGSIDERNKCRELNDYHLKIMDALGVSDSEQTFGNNKHKYPSNYFVVCMAKLLLCEQGLQSVFPPDLIINDVMFTYRRMKKIVRMLMDLLISARQNLNCHWFQVIALIVKVCTVIATGINWMKANQNFINVLLDYITFVTRLIMAVNFGDAIFVAGATAVGAGIGGAIGIIGGPPGIAAGTIFGGLIGGGLAAMYKYA